MLTRPCKLIVDVVGDSLHQHSEGIGSCLIGCESGIGTVDVPNGSCIERLGWTKGVANLLAVAVFHFSEI